MSDFQLETLSQTAERAVDTLRGDSRKTWEATFARLRDGAHGADPRGFAADLLASWRKFDLAATADEKDLLANPLLWMEGERELGQWLETAYRDFLRAALPGLERFPR